MAFVAVLVVRTARQLRVQFPQKINAGVVRRSAEREKRHHT
jgi:hypothetical protein